MNDQSPQTPTGDDLHSGTDKVLLPGDQGEGQPPTLGILPGTKEAEKITVIQKEIGRETDRAGAKEIEPGVEKAEVREISLEGEVDLPEDLRQMGVEALVPPEVPEEFQPQAEVVTLSATEDEVKAGASQPLINSMRWLSVVFQRLVRKVGGGFRYVFRSLGREEVQA